MNDFYSTVLTEMIKIFATDFTDSHEFLKISEIRVNPWQRNILREAYSLFDHFQIRVE